MKTRTLEDIIDCEVAPLVQWEPAAQAELSEGKRKEDALTHNAVVRELWKLNAQHITGIISDEARLEYTIAAQNSKAVSVTHLTLRGMFAIAARNNYVAAILGNRPNAEKVRITTDIDSIPPHSQDAVVMNMILGCLATPEDQRNIHRMLIFAAHILNAEGSLIIVRPNPEGGEFETYKCTTPVAELRGGDNYDFIVKGLEDLGPMKNLYTPDSYLKGALENAGFSMGATKFISSSAGANPVTAPFLLNVCEMRPGV